MTQKEIDKLLEKRIKEFERSLRIEFPKWDSFPEEAQLGLLDMSFNLGMTKLKIGFPNFMKAARKADWEAAASECRRPALPKRSENAKKLFKAAATKKKGAWWRDWTPIWEVGV